MIKKINNTEEIEARLTREGKTLEKDRSMYTEGIQRMNKIMEDVRRDFKVKNKNSEISASKTILTA